MARGLEDGLLRFCNGAWRDDDGDAVDIAEVVRCKDCKHYVHYGDGVYGCRTFGMMKTNPEGFCSFGERRTE